ncbi:MAG TPA: hypothetical protein VFS43_23805 [Polyangiaceae bacterium]|nr:hypothetical protein [Polyangiaceae bacterium]
MVRSLRVGLVSLLVASAATPACVSEAPKRGGSRGEGGGRGGTEGGAGPSGEAGPRRCPPNFAALDECATLRVPLDWDEPGGEAISIFYGKRRAKGEAKAQIWLLQGGPGGSAEVFSQTGDIDRLHEALPEVEVYVLEHRGVGESTRLGCDAQESDRSAAGADVSDAELGGCIEALEAEWGEGLRHFSSRAAARDLGAATDATRAPGQRLFVYGVSYGTYWAIQYLKERPADADGVILDSVATPGVQFFTDFGLQYDPVAERLAALCAADATCREKMGDDPYGAARSIMARLDAGHCFGDDAAPGALRALLSQVLQIGGANALVFPLLYRLDRCDPADRDALEAFFSLLVEGPAGSSAGPGPDSFALRMNIGFAEFWSDSPTRAEYDARCAEAAFCTAGDFDRFEAWPRYAPPADVHALPATAVPVLALNGDLDPQTPIEKAERVGPMLRGPAQTFVRVPFATHFVLGHSPVQTPGAPPCGFQLLTGFVRAPAAPPDLACLDDLAAPSFDLPPDAAERLFGTSDAWENEPDGFARAPAPRLDLARVPARPRRDLLSAALRGR